MNRQELNNLMEWFGYAWHSAEEATSKEALARALRQQDRIKQTIWKAIEK